MTASAKYVTFHEYAGFVVRASPAAPFEQPLRPALHMGRAVWLTGQLEAASWGTVQGYDGAAMSGGILHNIAVMPKDLSQGSLFGLLAEIAAQRGPVGPLWAAFASCGWRVTQDGKLRSSTDGSLVSGKAIRNEFTPIGGKVPPTGPLNAQAKRWALLFHDLLSDPGTRLAQSDYATRWLTAGNRDAELAVYRRFTNNPTLDSAIAVPVLSLPASIDLAMCVYHSFSANAPSIAARILAGVKEPDTMKWASKLIKGLGTANFGRWHDEPGDAPANRYDRCRRAVAKSGLWDIALCRVLMPVDL